MSETGVSREGDSSGSGGSAWSYFKFVFAFFLTLFALDALGFRLLFWRLPNETAWESEPHYNLEYRLRRAERERPTDEFRILVIGSSIGAYSVLPRRLERLLRDSDPAPAFLKGKRPRVHLLVRQGTNPMNLLALTGRLLDLKPDLVIWPLNMVDFRLERPMALKIQPEILSPGPLSEPQKEQKQAALELMKKDLLEHVEFRQFSPAGTLRHFFGDLSGDGRSAAILSILFASYRYRDLVPKAPGRLFSNRLSRGRSYLHYAGIPILAGGINHRGWTAPVFGLQVTGRLLERGLELEASPKLWTAPGARGQTEQVQAPRLEFWRLISRPGAARTAVCESRPGESLGKINLKSGWQNVDLRGAGVRVGDFLCLRVSPGFYSELFADILGIRLARNMGVGPRSDRHTLREIRREDELYLRYSPKEYNESFQTRVMGFERAGMQYLHALKATKDSFRTRAFDESWPTLQAFRQTKQILCAKVPLIVVNSPENPVSLAWYGESNWNKDFLKFLAQPPETAASGLSSDLSSGRGNFRFYDASKLSPRGEFYDFHHLSYFGAERFTDFLVERLRRSAL